MGTHDKAGELVAHLASLDAGPACESAGARALAAIEPVEAAHTLKVIVERAKTSAGAGQALAALSRALMFSADVDLPFAHRGRIYDAAAEFGLDEVAALFTTATPAKALDPNAKSAQDSLVGHLTLGHKKTLARQADPDKMARLAAEGDARVIHELMLNPRLTEGLVVRIVARRPAKADVLHEVWRSPRWSVRPSVRKALAMNPYTPPDIALKILPHLLVSDLKAIAGDGALHPSVRQLAAKLSRRAVPGPR